METVNLGGHVPALVTNCEVMELLSIRVAKDKARKKKRLAKMRNKNYIFPKTNHEWVEEKALEYLKSTNTSKLMIGNKCRKINGSTLSIVELDISKRVPDFISKLRKDFQLTDAECLQILNLLPKEIVDLHLIIQDLDDRLTEDKQRQVLDLIIKHSEGASDANTDPVDDGKSEDASMAKEDDVVRVKAEPIEYEF